MLGEWTVRSVYPAPPASWQLLLGMAETHALPDVSPPLAELWEYDDVAVEVLRCLPPRCLCRAAAVSRRWRRLAASDTLWYEKVAQVLSLPATAAKSALPLYSHSAKARSAAQWASPGTPQPPPHAAEERGASESEAQRAYADAGVCFASSAVPLLPFSPVLLAPTVAPSPGSASPGRPSPALHHLVSGSPQISCNREVYRGLVELDREWKVPPQLPLQAVGSSSEEEGWGAEWTLRDDFFWFSQVQCGAVLPGVVGCGSPRCCGVRVLPGAVGCVFCQVLWGAV
ncbi:unnamed protein product [Closterium sp. Yama58-4]|nr:unnamed protein product [Closterium sp. Yama58-4]